MVWVNDKIMGEWLLIRNSYLQEFSLSAGSFLLVRLHLPSAELPVKQHIPTPDFALFDLS